MDLCLNSFRKLLAINSLNITYSLFSSPLLMGLELHVLFRMFYTALICFSVVFFSFVLTLGIFYYPVFWLKTKMTEPSHNVIFYQKGFPLWEQQGQLLCAHVLSCFRRVWLFATLWTVASQAPLSMGFFRILHSSGNGCGLPCPPLGDLSDPRIEPISLMSPALTGKFFYQ